MVPDPIGNDSALTAVAASAMVRLPWNYVATGRSISRRLLTCLKFQFIRRLAEFEHEVRPSVQRERLNSSGSSLVQLIGLDDAASVAAVEVELAREPGTTQIFRDLKPGTFVEITEGTKHSV